VIRLRSGCYLAEFDSLVHDIGPTARTPDLTPFQYDPRVSMTSPPLAIVLAAGKGTRMKSDLPKVLFPVCGRPMVHFVLDALDQAGFKRKVVVVGHRADDVQAELSKRKDDLQFVTQAQQLGTGHAVMQCRHLLVGHEGPVIVVAGDSPLLQPSSLQKLLTYFESHQPALLLGTLLKEDPTGLGRIVRSGDGSFTGIVEHRDASEEQRKIREVNMSTYLFNGPDLLASLDRLGNNNSQGEYYLTDCAALLHEAGRPVEALPVLEPCESLSINDPTELAQVDAKMREMGYKVSLA
jgi:UDP-N-acetylglucosamine diphosphorylase/glucosamine-1-phosphate N-acetyltransferase